MVTLLFGRAGSGKTTRMMRAAAEGAGRGRRGQIFLVPEQFSLNAERELAAVAGNSISLSAEVMTFKSLSNRVFSERGGLSLTPIDAGGRLLTMYAAVSSLRDKLCLYGGAMKPEFLQSLVAEVDELKTYRVAPEDLCVFEGGEGLLPKKLSDLSQICAAYDALLTGGLSDPADRLRLLCEKLGDGGWFHGRDIYIDGFNGFTPAELNVVELMLRGADNVTIALCGDGRRLGEDIFEYTNSTADAIRALCARLGKPCVQDVSAVASRRADPCSGLAFLERSLCDYGASPREGADESVSIRAASTPYTECEAVCAAIKELEMRGVRRRSIAVLSRDPAYAQTAQTVFEKYGIPLFLDRTDSISVKQPIRASVFALRAAARGFRADDVLSLAKTGLAGITLSESDALELYAAMWDVSGSGWLKPFTEHPDGFGAVADESSAERLAELNGLRERLIAPLARLKDGLDAPLCRGKLTAFCEYLVSIGLPAAIDARAAALKAAGDSRAAAQYGRLWPALCEAMDQFALILGSSGLPAAEFADVFRLLLSVGGVGAIPQAADAVTFSEVGRARLYHPEHVFVLGMCDGAFPPAPTDGGILTSDDRRRLFDDAGIRLAPTDDELIAREQLVIYQTLAAPRSGLHMSYALSDFSGARCSPAYTLERAMRLLPGLKAVQETDYAFRTYAPVPCAELAATGITAPSALTASARDAAMQTDAGRGLLGRALSASSLRRGPVHTPGALREADPITASKAERYQTCRFAYFANYGLKLRPRKKARFEAAEVGSFLHYVLDKTASDVIASGSADPWRTVTKPFVRGCAEKHVAEYADEQLGGLESRTPRFKAVFARLAERLYALTDGIVDEFAVSRFTPVAFEERIGGDSGVLSFSLDGTEILLAGRIDRVDEWVCGETKYIRIIDYKSSGKKFDYGEIEAGLGLQLLLYLFAITSGDKALPAGVLYKPLLAGSVSVSRAELASDKISGAELRASRYAGVLLDDVNVVNAMEEQPVSGKYRYLPVGIAGKSSKNNFDAYSSVISAEQFNLLRNHIARLLKELKSELAEGRIECNPAIRSGDRYACDYCDYAAFCQFDVSAGDAGRELPSLKQREFFALHNTDTGKDGPTL